VLEGQTVNADQKSITEVKNYQLALSEIEKLGVEKLPLTIEQILNLHRILMNHLLPEEKMGKFRQGEIYIVDDHGDREDIRFTGVDPKKVPFLVNELLLWLEHAELEDLHPILRASIFHSHFVNIHPFSDGNGRMTRLLTALVLYKAGWDFRRIIVLEDFYNRDRQSYYNALRAASGDTFNEHCDFSPWIEYFTYGFLVEVRKVADAVMALGFANVAEESTPVYLDRDEVQIMDFLSTTGALTSSDVEDILGVAKRTSQLKIKSLLDKGLLDIHGNGPATYYTLKDK
jgi:Fic family protein